MCLSLRGSPGPGRGALTQAVIQGVRSLPSCGSIQPRISESFPVGRWGQGARVACRVFTRIVPESGGHPFSSQSTDQNSATGPPPSLREDGDTAQLPERSLEHECWGFRGGPVAKTPCLKCRRPRFDPWSEKQTPLSSTGD